MDKSRFNYLFERYFDKSATMQERNELMAYIEICGSDEELIAQMKRMYALQMQTDNGLRDIEAAKLSEDKSEKILEYILKPAEPAKQISFFKRKFKIFRQVAAAALILVCAGIALWYWKEKAERLLPNINKQLVGIKAGGNKAILTLADGTQIDLNEMKTGEITNSQGIKISKTADGKLIYEVLSSQAKAQKNVFNTISTPRGGQYQIKLPDGTQVWLNSSSVLRYPIHFSKTERSVELDGEGYFEVMKNPATPFKVICRNQHITVLGTHFNVNSYEDETNVLTTVLEGSVKVSPVLSGKEVSGQSEVLKINQQSILNIKNKQVKVKEVLATSAIAWKMGKFQFHQTNITEVLRQLSRWYNVDFRYEGKLPDLNLSGEIKRNVDAAEALEILKFFDLKYTVKEENSDKKVIIVR